MTDAKHPGAVAQPMPDLRDVLDGIRIYANDTLSGRADGVDDREWQRAAVIEIRNRARDALSAQPPAAPVDMVDQLVKDNEHLRAQLMNLPEAAPVEISQHIGWLKQYAASMNENNWRDMRMLIDRQLVALSKSAPPDVGSLPSGESDPSVTLDLGGADTRSSADNVDVVSELRWRSNDLDFDQECRAVFASAADEIECLRHDIERHVKIAADLTNVPQSPVICVSCGKPATGKCQGQTMDEAAADNFGLTIDDLDEDDGD